MALLITQIDQATPGWFTDVLTEAGYLDPGKVTDVQNVWSTTTIGSFVARLELSYSADAPASAPKKIFLKISDPAKVSNPEIDSDVGRRIDKNEIEFYRAVTEITHDLPVVRCYDAACDMKTGRAYLLLEDLSDTHDQTEWPVPPLRAHCEQIMDCLANFHAFWWEDTRLGEIPNENIYSDLIPQTQTIASDFLDFLSDRLSSHRRKIYENASAAFPSLWKTTCSGSITMHF